MRKQWKQNRRSFTLVELLVVIIIIGILAALITQTAMSALTAAREAAVKVELQSIAAALNQYKTEFKEYPPDFSDEDAVVRHVRLRWPRINSTGSNNELDKIKDLQLTPPQALVFWLRGFSGSPTHPYTAGGKRTSMVNFDKARLIDPATGLPPNPNASNPIHPVYVAQYGGRGGDGVTLRPFIYFDAKTYADADAKYQNKRPYLSDLASDKYAAQDSFQLIHPGLDGEWGQTTVDTASYPSGTGYLPADRDNIVNFASGRTLEDDIP